MVIIGSRATSQRPFNSLQGIELRGGHSEEEGGPLKSVGRDSVEPKLDFLEKSHGSTSLALPFWAAQ